MYQAVVLFIILLISNASANMVIYGEAETADGKFDAAEVVEPDNQNVMGAPIYSPLQDENEVAEPTTQETIATKPLEVLPKAVTSDTAPVTNQAGEAVDPSQIDNTLYESGNRIYDLQSYPLKDIKEIETPNIQPTISDY